MLNLSEIQIAQLKADKRLTDNYLKAVQRIHNLLETNKQQKKGIDRLRRKVEYYRQTTNGLVTLIQKSPCPEILFGNADRKYDGPKPGYKRPPTEDEIYDSQHPEGSHE